MRTTSTLLVAFLVLTTGLVAQGYVAPPHLTTYGQDPLFSPGNIPGTGCHQIHMIPHPGQPGKFIVALTVNSLSGGVGGYDFLTGVYDAPANTFTSDTLVAAINTTGTEFGFMMFHDGLSAVYESNGWSSTSSNEVRYATRPNLTSAWVDKGPVTNVPAQSYWDPSLALHNGTLHLLYMKEKGTTAQADIAMAPLNTTTMTLDLNQERIVVLTVTTGSDANSPTPIIDSTGELIGLSHHDQMNKNDHYFSFDLVPVTPSVLFITDPEWINNGGYAAGTFYDADNNSPAYHISSVQTCWWTGGRAALGTPMEISFYNPISSVPSQINHLFMISSGFLATPLKVPGLVGSFGLNPGLLIPINGGFADPLTGRSTIKLNIPNDPALKGVAVPGQSFHLDVTNPGGPRLIAGNTAALTIL